ncbi:MAG TPA: hypothetical protein VMW42_04135 [Desulfatiglandales bacterium]|nr:hypothetical protein [Desulfatiglandales bacterium]
MKCLVACSEQFDPELTAEGLSGDEGRCVFVTYQWGKPQVLVSRYE